ncbi:hypothetical protein [Williamsia sp. CHRR-6]|uniref:hypothetical protein n=1 Tax=Williamsia sp. CHRR-6 TaxID=2835871 RepID=UPI001BDA7562|nr:hypothetical protein [Williamsia sp. CHRR-6]MBT0566069.1 hypothetical protein [Williamsia sp. CHRR-6]
MIGDAFLSVNELQQQWFEVHGWATQQPVPIVLDPTPEIAATPWTRSRRMVVDDHEKHANETVARTNDSGAAAAGPAAGAATPAGIAALPVEVPAAVVAGIAGFAVVGVGGVGYESFHEHCSEDIHDHGVFAGVLHGTGNTFANTGGDLVDMGTTVGHSAKSLWKSVFG